MRILLIEDDPLSQAVVQKLIEKEHDAQLLATLANGADALRYLATNPIDLLLLDVELPDMTGLQLLQAIRQPMAVVLISGKMEYAVEAFRHNVCDYLLKPVLPLHFVQALQKARESLARPHPVVDGPAPKFIFVKVDNQYLRIDISGILYIEASRNNVLIHTRQGTHTVATKISNLESILPTDQFMRVHRSYIVNLAAIELLQGAVAVIQNKPLPISRDLLDQLERRLNIIR